MYNLHWLNAWHMPTLSICGCPKRPTMFLRWLLISFPPIRTPSTSSLACLRPMIWAVLLWLWSPNTSLTSFHSRTRLWVLSRTKGLICKLMFKLWKLWCLVVILTQLSHLMAIVLGIHYQRYAICHFQWQDGSHVTICINQTYPS